MSTAIDTTDVTNYLNPNSNVTQIANSGAELDKEDFLKLLAAQLSNQDPTDPVDSKELVLQLSQFSTLEGITNLNSNMGSFLDTMSVSTLSSLIGKQVTYYNQDLGAEVLGTVDSVNFNSSGSITLSVDGQAVDPTYVTSVSNPSTGSSDQEESN